MSKHTLLSLLVIVTLHLIVACRLGPDSPTTTDNVATPLPEIGSLPVLTPLPTITIPNVTATSTASPPSDATLTSTPTRTPIPTRTPRPTVTSSATPFAGYNIPSWLASPSTNLLLVKTVDDRYENYAVTIFNIAVGERFDIYLDDCCTRQSWLEQEGTLYIGIDHPQRETGRTILQEPYRELINTTTGEMSQHPPLFPGRVAVSSPDGRYVALISRAPSRIDVLDHEQNSERELLDLFNGRYSSHFSAAWTHDSALLAVLQVSFPEDRNDPAQFGLAIYTPGGEPFRMYDRINSNDWSPTPPYRILYTVGDRRTNVVPCILNVIENSRACLEAVDQWREDQEVKIGQFAWSSDGNKVSFTHWNYATNKNGLCYFDLTSEAITCPITASTLQSLGDNYPLFVVGHHWSPDDEYIAVFVNPNGLESSDATFTSIGIVSSDGTQFEMLDQAERGYQSDKLWWSPNAD